MAGSLTLRLTQTDPDESRHIALNPFVEALTDVLGGYHTIAQVKNFYNMTASDQSQLDTLYGKIDSATGIENKLGRIHRLRSILTKWEENIATGYTTADDIENKFLGIDTGFV